MSTDVNGLEGLEQRIEEILGEYGNYTSNNGYTAQYLHGLRNLAKQSVLALIKAEQNKLLDRVEREVLRDDGTNTMFTEWNGMKIADLDRQLEAIKTLREGL